MNKSALITILSLLVLSSVVFAVGAYIRPHPFILVEGYVKTGVINILPSWVETKNVNPYPVIVHVGGPSFIEFESNDFVLQPGELRVVNFNAIVTKWNGYTGFIDVSYTRTTGGFTATLSSELDMNTHANGTGVNNNPPSAPVLTQESIAGSVLNLAWTASADPDPNNGIIYFVKVDDNADFSSPLVDIQTTKLTFTKPLQPGTAYSWKVIAYDGKFQTPSVTGNGQTENHLPPIPAPISPENGVVVTAGPMLAWTSVVDPDGTPVYYDIVVDNNPDFSSPELSVNIISQTSYNTNGLLNAGTFYWRVRSRDNVGTSAFSAVRTFTLQCTDPYCFNIVINSPDNDTYNNKKILVDVSVAKNAKYISRALNSNFFTTMCSNCKDIAKNYTAREGSNNLTIKITGYNGEIVLRTIFFTVDSTKPRISKITPKDKSLVSGTVFTVKYTETNLQSVNLFYGNNGNMNQVGLQNCPRGSNKVCSIDLDLDDYDGQWVQYYFTVSDGFRSINSKTYNLTVDTVSPIFSVISPVNGGTYDNTARMIMNTNEKVKLQYSDNGGIYKTLCSSCTFYNATKYFKNGLHDITIRATDKAGNTATKAMSFTIV